MSKRTETKGLYKRKGIWYFDFYKTPTNRIRKSTRTASFLEALKIKEQFINNLESSNHQDFIGGCFFNDVVARFLEDKKRVLRERTIKDYKYLFKILSKFLA